MTKAKKIISSLAAIALIVMAGCEWSTPSSDETWTMNGYDWFDFSGTYSGADGGPVVSGFTYEDSDSESIINGELIASLSSSQSTFGGSFNNNSVIAGTVTIFAGDYAFVDDGLGYLVTTSSGTTGGDIENIVTGENVYENTDVSAVYLEGAFDHGDVKAGSVSIVMDGVTYVDDGLGGLSTSSGKTGTISYDTGAWSINIDFNTIGTVYASYVYITTTTSSTASGTINYTTGAWSINLGGDTVSGNVYADYACSVDQPFEPGNSGTPVVTLTIAQVGNKLTIYDSQGRQFSGTIGVANGSGGTTQPTSDDDYSTQVMAQFTAYYGDIEIVGTLSGLYTSDEPGVLFDRSIEAVWIEPGIQGDVNGTAGSIYVAEFADAVDTTTTDTD